MRGVREYWVVDLNNRKLHVHRDPGPEGYGARVAQAWDVAASPLFAPEMVLDLSSILRDLG